MAEPEPGRLPASTAAQERLLARVEARNLAATAGGARERAPRVRFPRSAASYAATG